MEAFEFPDPLAAGCFDDAEMYIEQRGLLPPGTLAEIEADVAEKTRVLGSGGGYLCWPAQIVQSEPSMENVEAFLSTVKKRGVYD